MAVCVGSPVDVASGGHSLAHFPFAGFPNFFKFSLPKPQVKSRVMGDSIGQYKGTIDCFVKTFRNDVMSFIPPFSFSVVYLLSCFVSFGNRVLVHFTRDLSPILEG